MKNIRPTSVKFPVAMTAAVDRYRARLAEREGKMPSFGAIMRQAVFELLCNRDVVDPGTINQEEWNVRNYQIGTAPGTADRQAD